SSATIGPPGYFSTSSVEAVWAAGAAAVALAAGAAAAKTGVAPQRTESDSASETFRTRRKGLIFIVVSLKNEEAPSASTGPTITGPPWDRQGSLVKLLRRESSSRADMTGPWPALYKVCARLSST